MLLIAGGVILFVYAAPIVMRIFAALRRYPGE